MMIRKQTDRTGTAAAAAELMINTQIESQILF